MNFSSIISQWRLDSGFAGCSDKLSVVNVTRLPSRSQNQDLKGLNLSQDQDTGILGRLRSGQDQVFEGGETVFGGDKTL